MKYGKKVSNGENLVDWFKENKVKCKSIWGSYYGKDILEVNGLDISDSGDREKFIKDLKKEGLWK